MSTTALTTTSLKRQSEPVYASGLDKLKQIDTTNPACLTQAWLVFNKVAPHVGQGERAKNMAFRMVQQGLVRRKPEDVLSQRQTQQDVSSTESSQELPSTSSTLPSSVISSHEDRQDRVIKASQGGPSAEGGSGGTSDAGTCQIQNRHDQSRSRTNTDASSFEQPAAMCGFKNEQSTISAHNVEKIMSSIHQPKLGPLTPPKSPPSAEADCLPIRSSTSPAIARLHNSSNPSDRLTPPPDQYNERRSSGETISTSTGSTHSIIRGFSSNLISRNSASRLVMASSKASQTSKALPLPVKRGGNMFSLGGGGSSNDDESPMDSVPQPRTSAILRPNKLPKHTSFSDEVVVQQSAPSDSDLSSDISDSAIEDDDDAEWEDDSGQASPQPKIPEPVTFQRTQSTTHLRPNRSALTLMMKGNHSEENDASRRAAGMPTSGSRRPLRLSNGPSTGNSFEGKPSPIRLAAASHARRGLQGPSALTAMPSAPDLATASRSSAHPELSSMSKPICIQTEARQVKQHMVRNEISGSVMKGVLAERQIKGRVSKAAENLKRSATTAGELSALARERQVPIKAVDPAADSRAKQEYDQQFCDAELNRYFDNRGLDYTECGW